MNKSKILYSLFFIFLFGITTITVLIISNSENNSAYSQRVLQTYENDKYGIKIQYPANWDAFEYQDFVDETGEAVVNFHPFKKNIQVFLYWFFFYHLKMQRYNLLLNKT